MKHCQWCDNTFTTKISYQIYCGPDCRTAATKEKIAERYLVSRRTRRQGKARACKSCQKQLSMYNDDVLCVECNVNPPEVTNVLKEIKGFANGKFKQD